MDFQSLGLQCLPNQISIRKPSLGPEAPRQGIRDCFRRGKRARRVAKEWGLKTEGRGIGGWGSGMSF